MRTPRFDLKRLLAGTIRQLENEAEYFSSLTSHNPEKGRLNESHLVKTLRRYLPPKFGIGTGFIIAGGTEIQESPQCDIIIYDALNNTPFYSSDAWQIYPIEMVYGVIEVKTRVTKHELKTALKTCAELRRMCGTKSAPNKAYIIQQSSPPRTAVQYLSCKSHLPPRFFVFGYAGPGAKRVRNIFQEVTEQIAGAHVHSLCVLDGKNGLYLAHIPYSKGKDRITPLDTNGLWKFLLNMPRQLDSMLRVTDLAMIHKNDQRNAFPYPYKPLALDLVDMAHYPRRIVG